jgi:hypothetical protein
LAIIIITELKVVSHGEVRQALPVLDLLDDGTSMIPMFPGSSEEVCYDI